MPSKTIGAAMEAVSVFSKISGALQKQNGYTMIVTTVPVGQQVVFKQVSVLAPLIFVIL